MSPTSEACRDVREYIAAKTRPNPIAIAHAEAVRRLACLIPPRLYNESDPEDFKAVAEFILDFGRIADAMLLSVGRECKSSATVNIDLAPFTDVLTNQLLGEAVPEINREIASLKEDRAA